jgi:glyoxylase-like metal-dependent hydrolase (beta-lactamase superfamily II)/rhodanese-related sulfurtransferase
MQIETIATASLGDRSYVVHDGSVAVVIDPQRDLDRLVELLDRRALTVALVLETHIHNDYVTGGLELARQTGARYGVNAEDAVAFDRLPLSDGQELTAGTLAVRVLATPGHTDTHLAFAVTDASDPAEPTAVFTGGSLLFGSVGRTDLVDPARTDELTRAQFRSAHRLAAELPDASPIFPTHGFGSFCSSGGATGGDASTIGIERTRNDAFTATDEQSFVDALVAGLSTYPAYYAHMAPLNGAGPGPADLDPPAVLDAAELGKRIAAGEWVVDLRDRVAYAADHLAGSIGIALGDQTATYVGWLAPWGQPLTLIGETPEQIADAQRQLTRIGIDHPVGAASGSVADLAGTSLERRGYPRVTFAELVGGPPPGEVVLDVRRDDEFAAGHLVGAAQLPLHALLTRLAELPDGRLWVHCASGFRAAIAASLLDRAGRDVVYVDDEFAHALALGLTTSTAAAAVG